MFAMFLVFIDLVNVKMIIRAIFVHKMILT